MIAREIYQSFLITQEQQSTLQRKPVLADRLSSALIFVPNFDVFTKCLNESCRRKINNDVQSIYCHRGNLGFVLYRTCQ